MLRTDRPEITADEEGVPEPGEAVAVAVSGGADSFALLHYLQQQGRRIVALTVDHGLRPGARGEAEAVAAWCEGRGIPHHILPWAGEKPTTGVQAAARDARYRLLIEACYRHGIKWLVTAHNADDQAETVFMRLRRGSGRGLAAMPLSRRVAAGAGEIITLGRPFLGVRRHTLQAYAAAHDLPIQSDPSNDDDRFERVRVRALLAALEQQDLLTVEAQCRVAEGVGLLLDGADIAQCSKGHGLEFAHDGAAAFSCFGLGAKSDEPRGILDPNYPSDRRQAREALLERTMVAIGAVTATTPMDTAALVGNGGVMSGNGCLMSFDARRPHDLIVLREPAALLGRADGAGGFVPMPVNAGTDYVFDRRFVVSIPGGTPPGTTLRPLGAMVPRDIATSTLDRQRAATLPVLTQGSRITHLPQMAVAAIHAAFAGWKSAQEHLLTIDQKFSCRSLISERFFGNVIRY